MTPLQFPIPEFLDKISDAFVVLDADWRFTYVNDKAGDITRMSPAALLGKVIWDEFPGSTETVFYPAFRRAREKQEEGAVTGYYALLDCWLEIRIYPVSGGVCLLVKDITQQKRAEEKLVRANRLYSFLSSIDKMIVRTGTETVLFSEVCDIAVRIGKFKMAWVGLIREEEKQVVPFVHAGEEKGYLGHIKNISLTGGPESWGPTGTAVREGCYNICNDIAADPRMEPWKEEALKRGYLSSIALPVYKEEKPYAVLSVYAARKDYFDTEETALLVEAARDITYAVENLRREELRKIAQEKLRESEEKFRTLVEQAADGIFIVDQEGNYLDANESASIITGYSVAELKQMNGSEIIPAEDLEKNPLRLTEIRKGKRVMIERVIRRKDGTLVNVELSAQLMDYGKVITIMRDITERKRTEKELQDSYKEIRELASHLQNIREEERISMAREIHDELGQQMTVLKMDVAWLEKKLAASDTAAREKIQELRKGLDQTIHSIRRIASELRPSVLDDMGLGAAIEWQLREFQKRSGVSVSFENRKGEFILPDAVKTNLFRIVQESLTNVARHANATTVSIKLLRDANQIRLLIKDDGIGFEKQKAPANKTLGILGMKERTAMLGGSYEISSTPGKGTLVTVTIPVMETGTPVPL